MSADTDVLFSGETAVQADLATSEFSSPKYRGLLARVVLSNLAGAPTYTPAIVRITPDGQTEDDVWTAASGLTANGTYLYQLYPGIRPQGSNGPAITEAVNFYLPARWKFEIRATTVSGTDNADIDADADRLR